MALLNDVPRIPEESELASLQTSFFTCFKQHVYLDAIDIPDTSQCTYPPYFPLALACLGSVVTPQANMGSYIEGIGTSQAEISATLFTAGVGLWCVVLEVDNREARLIEAVVAVSVYNSYP